VRYVPSSAVAHEGPATVREFLARRAFYGTTAAPLSRRHGEAVAPLHVSGWSLLVWTLVLARRPVLALTALSASIVVLAGRLRGLVRDPVGVAAQIAGRGTTRAAMPALASLTRAWAPAFVVGLAFRRTRRAAALALLVPALHEWANEQRSQDPPDPPDPEHPLQAAQAAQAAQAVAFHVADDVAYGAGVWLGCARERTLVPLIPRIAWRARVWSSSALRHGLQSSPPEKD
jgi:hypothetical protein